LWFHVEKNGIKIRVALIRSKKRNRPQKKKKRGCKKGPTEEGGEGDQNSAEKLLWLGGRETKKEGPGSWGGRWAAGR